MLRPKILLALVVSGSFAGCAKPPAAAPGPAPEKPKVEADLLCTTLAPDAYQSLGIKTATANNQPVRATLSLSGWVMAKQGNEVTVTAPVAGYVRAAKSVPVVGTAVQAEQELFLLEPVLTPVDQIQLAALKRGVEGELAKAREQLHVAESEMSRTQDLVRQGLRSQQEIEIARAKQKAAKEDRAAAEDKRKIFSGEAGTQLAPRAVVAPRAGTVMSVAVSPGQYVPAAAPLVTVADLSTLWLRVPVPEHYLAQLDRKAAVAVALKSATATAPSLEATPVALVPLVDPVRHTADMIYEVAPGKTPLARDQMVTVALPLGESREESVVPYSAVIYDAYGGTWIYLEKSKAANGDHVFERRRVELGPAPGGTVVVRPPLGKEERVVVDGAAGLFSREFHKTPVVKGTP